MEDKIEELRNIVNNNKTTWHILLKKRPDLIEFINEKTQDKLSDPVYKLGTKIYWILNGLTDFPCCRECEKNEHYIGRNVINVFKGYSPFCSSRCGSLNEDTQEKHKQTNIDRYGVESTNSLKDVIDKKQKSIAKKFGNGDLGFGYKEIHKKGENTCQERYGVKNVLELDENKEKRRKKCLETFGTEYTLQNKSNQKKCRDAKIKKYNGDPMHCKDVIDKMMHTWASKDECELNVIKRKTESTKKENRYNSFFESNTTPLFSIDEFKLNDYTSNYKWHCRICGNDFESNLGHFEWDGESGFSVSRCPICHPPCPVGISIAEREVSDFVSGLCDEVMTNVRSVIYPKELDVYIPDRKLAFEYDGLFWHGNSMVDDNKYHLKKTEECESQGIHLVHIFENEWLNKQDIVKSRIKNLLGIYDKVVYARKCEVLEIDSRTSIEFQNNNHIQGGVHSSVNIGLYYENELVSLMTFSKPRFDKKHEWELVRFCNKICYHVPGGASRLLKHFEREYNPRSIISYADRRWTMNSNDTVYDKLGFKLNSISKPNYWYFKKNDHELKLESRIKYQKHKLNSILEHFDSSKSEWENMNDNGYNRIFDCGNLVFVKKYDSRNTSLVV